MVDRKIIELPDATAVTADDLLLLVDGPSGAGTNRKLTIQTLLSNLHGRGLLSARPSADISNFGFFYFATDEGIFYQSDGSAWSAIAKLTLTSADIPSGIDATKIGAGTVDNTDFAFLAGTTSSIQSQLDGKQPLSANLTAVASVGTALQQIRVNSAGTGLEYFTPSSGGGTVTSVGLSLPAIFSVTGSPVTAFGTLAATLTNQIARTVFAAPTGATGTPSFRALEAADIQSGTLAIARGGTGLGTLGTSLQQIRVNSGGTALEYFTPTQDWSAITGTPTTLSGYGITDGVSSSALAAWTGSTNLTALGTITTGVWNGSAIAPTFGGTGLTTLGATGQSLRVDAAGTGLEWFTPSTGGGGSLPSLSSAQIWIGDDMNTAVARSLTGAITVSDTGVTTLGAGVVGNSNFRASAANSVVGRALSGAGSVGDIVAAPGFVCLRRTSTAGLAFGQITFNHITASADTLIGCGDTAGTAQEIPCTPFARTLLDDADAPTARATLGIAAATNSGSVCDGRLTLTSGVPDTSGTNVIGATTIFFTPYIGNLIALWNTTETRWQLHAFSQLSLSLAGTAANTNYDVFIYDNAGTLTLEWVAWANSEPGAGVRAIAINRLDGVWVKSTDSRRYLGTFRTTSAGMTEVSETGTPKCFLQNAVNRVRFSLRRNETAFSWTYTTTALRPTNNNSSNRVEIINGAESVATASYWQAIGFGMSYSVGVGINSTTVSSAFVCPANVTQGEPWERAPSVAVFSGNVPVGYSLIQMLEKYASGTGTIYGGEGNSSMIVEYWA